MYVRIVIGAYSVQYAQYRANADTLQYSSPVVRGWAEGFVSLVATDHLERVLRRRRRFGWFRFDRRRKFFMGAVYSMELRFKVVYRQLKNSTKVESNMGRQR